MRTWIRFSLGLMALFGLTSAYLFSATQHYLPKYNSSGTLVDSTMRDVDGVVYFGGSPEVGRITYNSEWFYVDARNGRSLNLSNGRMVVMDSGKVGIGTTTPGVPLSLGTTTGDSKLALYEGGGSSYGFGIQPYEFRFHVSASSADFRFFDGPSGNALMTIKGAGNVGIGTTAPSSKLHVVGNVTVDGNIGAKYQDVAEWVPSQERIAPGTVVAADPDHRNHVRTSSAAYDTAVAGVVSAQPGILLGEKSKGAIAVAQSGRVAVKVDASFGAIAPGDLLVSSPVPGYAMRSEPVEFGGVSMHRPGTIIGKALERLDSGRAEILVLLTLQ